MKTFADKLKEERKKRHMTQAEIAELLHMSRSSYSLYETGKREPDLQTIRFLSDTLNLYMGDLVTDWSTFNTVVDSSELKDIVSPNELELLRLFHVLNASGQDEAIKRIRELTLLSQYRESPYI